MFNKKGLVYSMIDYEGNKIGVLIKASSFYVKPTLRNLEIKFEKNKELRKPYRDDLKRRVEQEIGRYNGIMRDIFIAELQKQNIHALFRQNEQGFVFGLTFINHRNKTVFNGSDLGKSFTAKGIMERLSEAEKQIKPEVRPYLPIQEITNYLKTSTPVKSYLKPKEDLNRINITLNQPAHDQAFTFMHSKKKKRKKKPGMSL